MLNELLMLIIFTGAVGLIHIILSDVTIDDDDAGDDDFPTGTA